MTAPLGNRTIKLPYDGKTPISMPASARATTASEIQEIPLALTQGDRIQLAKKRQPQFSGNAGQPGEASSSAKPAGDAGGDDLPPPGLLETAAYLDTKVQALAKEKNITLQELPEDNANQYKAYLFLSSTPHSVLASISSIEPSKLLEMVDKHPETPNLIQQLLHARLGLQLDANVQALANGKNITLSDLSPEQGMVYQNALKNSVEALYQDNPEGSGSNEPRQAEDAILNNLLTIRQNPSSAGSEAEGVSAAAASSGQVGSAPQGTPENGDTAAPTSGEQTVQGATDPKAADGETKSETTKPADDKKETNADKKEEQNWKNGYIGWKAGIGAALLAGGIALKMTIIGIVPGLIMAGVGAALMGWSGINWLSKDK